MVYPPLSEDLVKGHSKGLDYKSMSMRPRMFAVREEDSCFLVSSESGCTVEGELFDFCKWGILTMFPRAG